VATADWMEIERVPEAEKIEEALLRGDTDACMLAEINPKLARHTPGVRRLWPNFREVEKEYYLRTNIFPIRHVVVVKNPILERYPWVARSLVEAFTKAKEMGIRHVSDTRHSFLAWYGAELEEERELFGDDAWPYNIEDNRVPPAWAHQQTSENNSLRTDVPTKGIVDPDEVPQEGHEYFFYSLEENDKKQRDQEFKQLLNEIISRN
jgi:4,5-dihydroxyphthalate decarboxylase